jgi:hypothetical protein
MVTGRGRLVPRRGRAVGGTFHFEIARRPGLYEGWFSGKITRIAEHCLLEEITLLCADGVTLQLTITTFSLTRVTFTAPVEKAAGLAADADRRNAVNS